MCIRDSLYIGERTAERVKIEVGSAVEELDVDVEDIPVPVSYTHLDVYKRQCFD